MPDILLTDSQNYLEDTYLEPLINFLIQNHYEQNIPKTAKRNDIIKGLSSIKTYSILFNLYEGLPKLKQDIREKLEEMEYIKKFR